MNDIVVNFLFGLGLPIGLILFILYLLFFPEKCAFISSKIYKFLEFTGKWANKKKVESRLCANWNRMRKSVNKNLGAILPYDIKINWVKPKDIDARQSFLDENRVVVCLDKEKNNDLCIIDLVSEVVRVGLFPDDAHCIDERLAVSSQIILTGYILKKSFDSKSYSHYHREIYEKMLLSDENIRTKLESLCRIDSKGMFVEIFLRELKKEAAKVIYLGDAAINRFKIETDDFLKFLVNIADRGYEEKVELQHKTSFYSLSYMIFAKSATIEMSGIDAHLRVLNRTIDEGYRSIYISAHGKKSALAKSMIKQLKEHKEDMDIKEVNYCVFSKNGSLVECCYYVVEANA